MLISNGTITTKSTLLDASIFDNLISGHTRITKKGICRELVNFEINRITWLHIYALDYDTLSVILNYMENNYPKYICSLVMKDNHGKSPLDIALDKRFYKNIELMIKKLWLVKDQNLSHLFSDRFTDLFSMNITAFYQYLDGCFFQTFQMRDSKYIELKNETSLWLAHHQSWLIDEVFRRKYCKISPNLSTKKLKAPTNEELKKYRENVRCS